MQTVNQDQDGILKKFLGVANLSFLIIVIIFSISTVYIMISGYSPRNDELDDFQSIEQQFLEDDELKVEELNDFFNSIKQPFKLTDFLNYETKRKSIVLPTHTQVNKFIEDSISPFFNSISKFNQQGSQIQELIETVISSNNELVDCKLKSKQLYEDIKVNDLTDKSLEEELQLAKDEYDLKDKEYIKIKKDQTDEKKDLRYFEKTYELLSQKGYDQSVSNIDEDIKKALRTKEICESKYKPWVDDRELIKVRLNTLEETKANTIALFEIQKDQVDNDEKIYVEVEYMEYIEQHNKLIKELEKQLAELNQEIKKCQQNPSELEKLQYQKSHIEETKLEAEKEKKALQIKIQASRERLQFIQIELQELEKLRNVIQVRIDEINAKIRNRQYAQKAKFQDEIDQFNDQIIKCVRPYSNGQLSQQEFESQNLSKIDQDSYGIIQDKFVKFYDQLNPL